MRRPLILFLIIFILWGVYRYFFNLPEWIDEFVFKSLIMLVPVLITVAAIEKRSLSSIGFSKKDILKNLFIGFGVGIFLVAESFAARQFKYGLFIFNPEHLGLSLFTLALILPFVTGFIEETLFRGYLLTRFLESTKNSIIAVGLSSVLFAIVHLFIFIFVYHYDSAQLSTSFMIVIELGIVNGIIFQWRRTLVAPTIAHAIWNMSPVLFG